ncbi:hypothetical protein CB1_000370043 [Camelus ferus]|nr:hypothetical protein CB1_000370043 [Camelus ferus]
MAFSVAFLLLMTPDLKTYFKGSYTLSYEKLARVNVASGNAKPTETSGAEALSCFRKPVKGELKSRCFHSDLLVATIRSALGRDVVTWVPGGDRGAQQPLEDLDPSTTFRLGMQGVGLDIPRKPQKEREDANQKCAGG